MTAPPHIEPPSGSFPQFLAGKNLSFCEVIWLPFGLFSHLSPDTGLACHSASSYEKEHIEIT
jgi:hypothetical protein